MAEQKYYGVWTQKGLEKLALFASSGASMTISHVGIGDGNGTTPIPTADISALVNEKWRGNVSSITQKEGEGSQSVVVEIIIPYDVGGFFIREWGLYDSEGDLIVYGNHSEFYKSELAEGTGAELRELFELPISSEGQVNITVSYESLASVDYIKSEVEKILETLGILLYPGAIFGVYESEPPAKCAAAHGQLLSNVGTTVPLLLDNLLNNPDLQDLKCTEAEWQVIYKNDSIWRGNVGACGYFVVDTANNTIRLPDLRGLVAEFAGFDGLAAGGVHGDMIRNIEGAFGEVLYQNAFITGDNKPLGCVSWDDKFPSAMCGGRPEAEYPLKSEGDRIAIDTSLVVPTGTANKTRAVGFLPCVYVG